MERYQYQNSSLTLQQGIEEYRAANPHLVRIEEVDRETAQFFTSHDRIHVVFGLNTSVAQEGMADLWTLMGSDVGFIRYVGYLRNPTILKIAKTAVDDFKKAGFFNEAKQFSLNLKKIYMYSRKMKRKWPWSKNEAYLNTSLKEIREDFGIQLVSQEN